MPKVRRRLTTAACAICVIGIEERDRKRDVIAAPERVEAQPVDLLDDLHQLVERRHPRPGCGLGAPQHGVDANFQGIVEGKRHLSIGLALLGRPRAHIAAPACDRQ